MRIVAGVLMSISAWAMAAGCGSRTGLFGPTGLAGGGDAGLVDAAPDVTAPPLDASVGLSCADFPAIPAAACPSVCAFSPAGTHSPVLAALGGQNLLVVDGRGTVTSLFGFGASASDVVQRILVARGGSGCSGGSRLPVLIGAMVVAAPGQNATDIEFVLMRGDGTPVAHHRESFPVNASGIFNITANAGGVFALGVGVGDVGRVWTVLPDGKVLGPAHDVALPAGPGWPSYLTQPDARGRLLVMPQPTNGGSYDWLDPCAGTLRPAMLPVGGQVAGWGTELFGLDRSGQPSIETADGVMPLAHAPLPQAGFWDFAPAGVAMFAVPPFESPGGLAANLLRLNATTLADRPLSLGYGGGLHPTSGSFLSQVGDSNNPPGFGIDSAGNVTMFLTDVSNTTSLYATPDGMSWTPVGMPTGYDPEFDPSYSLAYAEAAGTYVVQGLTPGVGKTWQVVRPAAGVDALIGGQARISRDGQCVAALVSSSELDVMAAKDATLTRFTLPVAVEQGAWVSTWIPGDDAVLPSY